MENKNMISIINSDGSTSEVELVTFLISEDESKSFVVYTKGETQGPDQDKVIYISRFEKIDNKLSLIEIIDDTEWNEVLRLLKKVANSK